MSSKRIPGSLVVFLLALAFRAVYLLQIQGTPVGETLLIDSYTYDRLAKLILAGSFHGEEVYAMNILYPYFVAGIYAVGGMSPLLVTVVQAVLGALNCVLVYRLGMRLFGSETAWTAGVLAALYPPSIFYSGAVLTPVLINTFCLGMLTLLVRYATQRSWLLLVPAGLLLGLAGLGRGNSFLLVPLALAWFRVLEHDWRTALRRWSLFASGAAFLLVLVVARNYLVERQFVPVSANYAAFYIGHNQASNGLYTAPDFVETAAFEGEVMGARETLSRRLGRELTLADASRYLFSEGLQYVVNHPIADLKLTGRKLYYFWNRTESPTNLNLYLARDFSGVLRGIPLHFGLIAPFALLGMVLFRRYWRDHLILYLYASVYVITCLLFFVSAEYRMPIVPVLLLFAAAAVVRMSGSIVTLIRKPVPRGRSSPNAPRPGATLITAILVLPPLLVACNLRDQLLTMQSLKRVDYYNLGTLYKDRNDFDKAENMLRRSLEIDPAFQIAYASLIDLENRRGDPKKALEWSRIASQYRPSGSRPAMDGDRERVDAERLYAAKQYASARGLFESARSRYEVQGNQGAVISMMNNIGLCHYKLKEYGLAETVFGEVIEADPKYVRAHTNLALVYEATARPEEAVRSYQNALALEPGNAKARRALARLSGGGP